MSLTAGTVLQSGKYVIQAVLDQSALGTTYQANHVYLEQTVIIQTVNQKPPEAEIGKLQERFLAGVRLLAQGKQDYRGRVLDYFIEAQMPFVVLEPVAGKIPPNVQDWLPSAEPEDSKPQPIDIKKAEATNGKLHSAKSASPQELKIADSVGVQAQPLEATSPVAVSKNGAKPNPQAVSSQENQKFKQPDSLPSSGRSAPKTSPWLPLSLIMTSVLAGVAGASMGWVVRFEPSGQLGGNGNTIFSNEQSFPPAKGWPVENSTGLNAPAPVSDRFTNTPRDEYPQTRRSNNPVEAAPAEPVPEEKVGLPESEVLSKPSPSSNSPDDLFPSESPLSEPGLDSSNPPLDPLPNKSPEIRQNNPAPPVTPSAPPLIPPPPMPSSMQSSPAPIVQ